MLMSKTYMAKKAEVKADWHVVDAADKVLGRLAVKVATVLMGKHRPTYTPHVDTGEFVIVTNAAKVRVTGAKLEQKGYDWYTGYPGGYKVLSLQEMMDKHPDRVITAAVRRMLPKNKLGTQMLSKLKVYAGPEHPHQAQQPKTLEIE